LFSIAYRQHIEESCAGFYVEATISLVDQGVMANLQLPAIPYVIENKPLIKLAYKRYSFRTHDVPGIKGVKAERQFPATSYVIENKARSWLAPRSDSFRTHDVYEAKWFSARLPPFDSSRGSRIASLYVASTLGGRAPRRRCTRRDDRGGTMKDASLRGDASGS
jgi:hypothetical protein